MINSQPIGFFDSGIGGTSIWKEVTALLPFENTIYLSDSLNAPYGEKSQEKIIEYCVKNTELLLSKGCKIIVVACNTATTNAIDYLRNKYDIPFIGIEPAIKPAALHTNTNSVGILATKGTLSSALFSKTADEFASGIVIVEQIGSGLVELIEKDKINSTEMNSLLQKYLNPMMARNIDYLVLGCTHYPYLIPQIQQIIGKDVEIIDSGLAVAKQTKTVLERLKLNSNLNTLASHQFYINKDKRVLQNILSGSKSNYTIEELNF